jgi:hypothetical protein
MLVFHSNYEWIAIFASHRTVNDALRLSRIDPVDLCTVVPMSSTCTMLAGLYCTAAHRLQLRGMLHPFYRCLTTVKDPPERLLNRFL